MPTQSSDNNKRIAKNTILLYLRMFLVLIVSLYTSRVILQTLGIEDFGIYNVVAGFVSLFGFLNATLSSSMQRFYNYELGKHGIIGVNEIYTTGLYIHIIFAIGLLLIFETFGLWYINNVMVIPDARLYATNWVFQSAVVSMILVILQIPYLGAILAYEKMNFYAYISIADVLLKLLIVLILPAFSGDKLILYSILFASISVANFLSYSIYAKKRLNGITFNGHLNKEKSKELLSFTGWNLIGTFAFLLKGQGLNLLLNIFFGPVVNAARGISFQINNAVSGFSGNIATAFRPQIVLSYSQQAYKRTTLLFSVETRACFSLILLLILPIILEAEYILKLWLGVDLPEYAVVFTKLVLIDLLICTMNTPVSQIAFAVGTIRKFQIASSIVNLLLIPTAFVMLKMNYPPTIVFILTICFSIFNQVVCIAQLGKIFTINITAYIKDDILPCGICMLICFIPLYLINTRMDESFLRLLAVSITDIIWTSLIIILVVLKKNERTYLYTWIKKFTRVYKKTRHYQD